MFFVVFVLFCFVFCFVFVRFATANIMASKKCGLYFCRFERLILRLQMSPVLTAEKKKKKDEEALPRLPNILQLQS